MLIWKSQKASSDQNTALLSKPAKSLAGGGVAPITPQERNSASEESKRNALPGNLAKQEN